MKNINLYHFRLFLIRFIIIGMMSYVVEVFFTGTINFVQSLNKYLTVPGTIFDLSTATQGHVGIFAFFIYCWAAIPFTFLTNPLKSIIPDDFLLRNFGTLLRGIVYGLIFLGIEFILGMFLLLVFKLRAWDYSNLPLNVFGVISFVLLPAWTLAGIIGEAVHERLLQIDDILANPQGLNDENVKLSYEKYTKTLERKTAGKKQKSRRLADT